MRSMVDCGFLIDGTDTLELLVGNCLVLTKCQTCIHVYIYFIVHMREVTE